MFARPITETDLIAFHMNELSPRRARAVQRAIKGSPALAAEAAAIAATLQDFKQHAALPHVDSAVVQRSWDAVRSSLQPHPPVVYAPPTLRMPLLLGGGLAAFATLAVAVSLHRSAAVQGGDEQTAARGAMSSSDTGTKASAGSAGDTASVVHSESPFVSLRTSGASGSRLQRNGREWESSPAPSRNNSTTRLIPLASLNATTLHYPSFEMDPHMQPMPLTLPMPKDLHVVPVPYTATPPSAGSEVSVKTKKHRSADVMLAMGGDFIASQNSSNSTGSGATLNTTLRTQSASHAVMAMAAVHQQIRPYVGYRLTVSYARPDFQYSSGAANTYSSFETGGDINSRIYELAGTYVVRGPHARKLGTTADAGAGLMAFLPTNQTGKQSYMYRGSAVLGVNADLALGKRFGVRAGYRAQLFKSPDFHNTDGTIPVTSRATVSSEPFVGITYRLGGATAD